MRITYIGSAALFSIMQAISIGPALGQECSNAQFKGRYATLAEVAIFAGGGNAGHNFVSGTLYADGAGVITEWKDTFVFVPPGEEVPVVQERDAVAAAAAVGEKATYTVKPDCRIDFRVPLGPAVLQLTGALVHGGREVFTVQTSPSSAGATGIMKSIDPPASEELAAIKNLLNRIAIRNGIRP